MKTRSPGRRRPTIFRGLAVLVTLLAVGVGIWVAFLTRATSAAPPMSHAQRSYLALAKQGVAKTSMWWDGKLHWYLDALRDHKPLPLATLWDTNGLFEALDEIAIAQPNAQNLAALTSFANGSERYWNGDLKPIPGYASYPGDTGARQQTWFDDNGWIGLAFLDAYRATGNARYLSDAERAFTFIAAEGWDKLGGGGIWWSTRHPWRSGEALAAAADLAARLYQATRNATYLNAANTYIGWANKHLLQVHGVYIRTANTPYPHLIEPKTPSSPTATPSRATHFAGKCPRGARDCKPGDVIVGKCPGGSHGCKPGNVARLRGLVHPHPRQTSATKMVAMPHDGEGAMLSAITTLCEATGKQSWCKQAEKLAAAEIVWLAPFTDGPQYDSTLIRGLLTLYAHDHRPRWYRFAVDLARLIASHAKTAPGVYLHGWDGRPVPSATRGMLRTDAGSISVFADLATVAPPF